MSVKIVWNSSGNIAEVDSSKNLLTTHPWFNSSWVAVWWGSLNSPAIYSEIDDWSITWIRETLSPEVDKDYRLRVAHDNRLDQELFNYTAQNTGKHTFTFTTLAATIGTSGITTNSGSITTTTTGLTFGTHAQFPVWGTETIVAEIAVAFSAQPNANTVIDFGLFQRWATTAFAPLDGFYFRMNSAWMFWVINSGWVETTSAVFPSALWAWTYVYTNNQVNRFLIQANNVSVTFWINNYQYAEIPTPVGANFPCKSLALPWSFRHAIVGGAAGAVTQALFSEYKVYVRWPQYADNLGTVGNRVLWSYQGLSGWTMGTIGTYTNSTNPTAAVPTNTTAAVGAVGLLNQAWETFSLAVNTDWILLSYQVPAWSSTVQWRRLKVNWVKLSSFVQTVLAGWPISRVFSLAFWHTAVSMATAESASMASATTKARRIVLLPELTQHVTAAQAVNTAISQPWWTVARFDNPIYVNPWEFIAVTVKWIGTVGTSGTIVNHIQLDYSWE